MSPAKREALQARTYVLRVMLAGVPTVSRTLELRATQTLAALHQAIQQAFELASEPCHAFRMSDRALGQGSLYEVGKNAERVTLQAAGVKPGRRFFYLFHYHPQCEITVESEGQAQPEVGYPRVLAAEGEARRKSWFGGKLDEDLEPLAAAVGKALRQHRARRAAPCGEATHALAPPELDEETLRAQVDLAERLLTGLTGRPDQREPMWASFRENMFDWLEDVCFTLARQGHLPEALRMHAAWGELYDDEFLLGSRAFLLADGGQGDAAVAELEQAVAQAPGDLEAVEQLAGLLHHMGRLPEAEAQYRRILSESREGYQRRCAAEDLAMVLRLQGREEEAAAREEEAAAREEAPASSAAVHQAPPALPKIGRNEPCPCGSGAKYKRCCGR
jgi:tetratricopeptide (TPR) repeat protein